MRDPVDIISVSHKGEAAAIANRNPQGLLSGPPLPEILHLPKLLGVISSLKTTGRHLWGKAIT